MTESDVSNSDLSAKDSKKPNQSDEKSKAKPFTEYLNCYAKAGSKDPPSIEFVSYEEYGKYEYVYRKKEPNYVVQCVKVENGAECTQNQVMKDHHKRHWGKDPMDVQVYITLDDEAEIIAKGSVAEASKNGKKQRINHSTMECEKIEKPREPKPSSYPKPDSGGSSYYPQGHS
ncbi:MAG: hypothetical protein NTV34_17260 [Proteobacteria bacterium]|nr:hypothetical protein [Pseudomonadota bacterium]